ncbi:hypothetical protein GQ44DRAFT_830848 [Phaeosphaeriaceae sp. PMI808]|nr:hypothetical protein GQ44DRAFT_830848 [Phaeosphaeriaceae sp. PMI808]
MVCTRSLAIFLGIALSAQANTHVSDLEKIAPEMKPYFAEVIKPSNAEALWGQLAAEIQATVPGITCKLGGPATERNASIGGIDYTELVEQTLLPILPELRCTGQIDETALIKAAEEASKNKKDRRTPALQRRADAAIDATKQRDTDLASTRAKQFISSCNRAPHPGNCRACATGYLISSVGGVGVCATAAYFALSVPGADHRAILGARVACGGKIVGDLLANINACWTRFYP